MASEDSLWTCSAWRRLRRDLAATFQHLRKVGEDGTSSLLREMERQELIDAGKVPSGYEESIFHYEDT